ncbi:MAG: C40 family peptidase [Parachlamydiaceae bacterium]
MNIPLSPHFDPSSSFCYIHQSVVDMREDDTHKSKVVSQAIFSEKIQIKEQREKWSLISTPDGYLGWIPSDSFILRHEPYDPDLYVSRLAAHLYELKDVEYGPIQTLPYASCLKTIDSSDPRWIKLLLPNDKECYIQKGDVDPVIKHQNKPDIIKLSINFLGLPYTWGGRSSFGYDCSGFVQMLYQQMGILLQRDATQQASDERFKTICFNSLKKGDLLFFGHSEKEIKHVGMSLNKHSFIHATSKENQPWIRISPLSDFEWSGQSNASYPFRKARRQIDLLKPK